MRIVLVVVLVLTGCGKKDESAHMKHARELLSIGEWASARTELKLELKDHPQDTDARGLLMYALDHTDDLDKEIGAGILDLYVLAAVVGRQDWNEAPQEQRDEFNKLIISTRQSLYDKGVDTKDSKDLEKVVVVAARFGFEKDDDSNRKDVFAAILADDGDPAAIKYLIERLKSQKPERATEYLASVGVTVVPALKQAVADHAFIGRAAALDALAHIQAELVARTFVSDDKAMRNPQLESSIPGFRSLGASFTTGKWKSTPLRVHSLYVATTDGADGVLLLQSWNSATKTTLAGIYAFRDGEMKRLRVVKGQSTFELGGPSAIFGLETEPGILRVHRLNQHTADREVETGRMTNPAVGMKVRLVGYKPHGEVVRQDDGGLWVVRVDQPIEGMNELTVAANTMIGLRTEPHTETMTETITAKVVGDQFQVTQDDVKPGLLDAMSMMHAFKDEMCACTDTRCAQRVSDDMTKWGQEQANNKWDPPKMTEADTKEATEIGTEMGECMQRAMR